MANAAKRVNAYLAACNCADGDISTGTFDKVYAQLLSEMKKKQAQDGLADQLTLCDY